MSKRSHIALSALRLGGLGAALLAGLAACLDKGVDTPYANMCEIDEDCGGNKICDQGVCWGDPPDSMTLAAIVIPPADRIDLAPTELTPINISSQGEIQGLTFAETVLLHGRVTLACAEGDEICDPSALVPAQIVVERASKFAGGPQYRRTVSTNLNAELGEDSFSISLPKDGAEYRVTIIPDDTNLGLVASAGRTVQAPPISTLVRADGDLDIDWQLGKPDALKFVDGCIVSSTGNGAKFKGMQVTAFGRWTPLSKATRASSVVTTDAGGCFSVAVPIDMLDDFDIVAKPGPGQVLPTLRLSGLYVRDPDPEQEPRPLVLEDLVMPNAANPVTFKLPLVGMSSGGPLEPVGGTTVYLETTFELPPEETRNLSITYATQAVSQGPSDAEPGTAVLELYPGNLDANRSYRVRAIPGPESVYGSEFDALLDVGLGEGAPVLDALTLSRRVPVKGSIVNHLGEALTDTPINVRVAPNLRDALSDASERTLLDNLRLPSDLSGSAGEFLIWLDAELLGLVAKYDLEVAPSDFSSAPRWSFDEWSLDQVSPSGTVDLGELALPAASYARGQVRDAKGALVPGAEVRWFLLPPEDYCALRGLDADCRPLARSLGIWESNADGEVLAVLPAP